MKGKIVTHPQMPCSKVTSFKSFLGIVPSSCEDSSTTRVAWVFLWSIKMCVEGLNGEGDLHVG